MAHKNDPHSVKQSDLDALGATIKDKVGKGEYGTRSGPLYVKGNLWGWSKKVAVLENNFLNFYNRIDDVALGNASYSLEVGGCQANMCNASKHGRDFVMEIIIQNPRSVHPVAADSSGELEAWIDVLNKVKVVEETPSGHIGNLTDAQSAKLSVLRNKLSVTVEAASDADLLRFLRQTSFDVEAAYTMYTENEIWRKNFNIQNLKITNVIREIRLGKMRVLPANDKAGRPVIVFKPATHIPGQSSPLEVMKLLAYNMEFMIRNRLTAPMESVVVIIDFADMRPRNVDLRVPKLLIETMQNRYPERVHAFLVVNAPWFFRFVWATVRTFFNPDMLKKVHILGSDLQTLQAFVPPECLLREHGGILEYNHNDFIKERCAEEGVAETAEEGSTASAFEGGVDPSLMESLQELPAAVVREGAVKTGMMVKLGGVVKNWKQRFFVLSSAGLLYYYKDENSESPQGVIPLERSSVGDPPPDSNKKAAFSLITPLRTYVFSCENDEQKAAWSEAISKVCAEL